MTVPTGTTRQHTGSGTNRTGAGVLDIWSLDDLADPTKAAGALGNLDRIGVAVHHQRGRGTGHTIDGIIHFTELNCTATRPGTPSTWPVADLGGLGEGSIICTRCRRLLPDGARQAITTLAAATRPMGSTISAFTDRFWGRAQPLTTDTALTQAWWNTRRHHIRGDLPDTPTAAARGTLVLWAHVVPLFAHEPVLGVSDALQHLIGHSPHIWIDWGPIGTLLMGTATQDEAHVAHARLAAARRERTNTWVTHTPLDGADSGTVAATAHTLITDHTSQLDRLRREDCTTFLAAAVALNQPEVTPET